MRAVVFPRTACFAWNVLLLRNRALGPASNPPTRQRPVLLPPQVLTNRVVDDITESPAITASDLQLVDLRPYDEKVR